MVLDTTPLLSPTMEMNLLKQNWTTTDLLVSPSTLKMTTSTMEEDNTVFSNWEENYQDLSGWCIETFQGRCAFPIGEFETNECSGMKSEDNGISIRKTDGAIDKISRGLYGDQEEEGLEELNLKIPEVQLVRAETRSQSADLQLAIKSEMIEYGSNEVIDVTLNPIDSAINQRTDNWIRLDNVNLPNSSQNNLQHKSINDKNNGNIVSVEYPNSIPREDTKDPREINKNETDNWETIFTFDNEESDNFDLLSYLCDDDIQSPDGSVVSRDSGPTINSNSSIVSHIDETSSSTSITTTTTTTTRDQEKNQKRIKVVRRDYDGTNLSSSASIAAISAALDSVAKMSKRSSRNCENRNSRSSRNEYEENFETGRGKKRLIDSDSEDRNTDGCYRESREKNNEASRKSRQNKKAKEHEMMTKASELERDNRILKMKVDELDKLVTSMRTAILRSALKKG